MRVRASVKEPRTDVFERRKGRIRIINNPLPGEGFEPPVPLLERIAITAGKAVELAVQLPEEDPARDRILDLAATSLVIGTFPEHHVTKDMHE